MDFVPSEHNAQGPRRGHSVDSLRSKLKIFIALSLRLFGRTSNSIAQLHAMQEHISGSCGRETTLELASSRQSDPARVRGQWRHAEGYPELIPQGA